MPKLKIKKGDHVVVITGKDKGKKGEVLKVIPSENRAIVQGVGIIRRHQKQSPSQEGGIIAKEAAVRVGYKFLKDGRKVRYAKRSGEMIDG
jgi:large subunit ribosomal protein L24